MQSQKYVNSQLKTNEIRLPDGTITQDDIQNVEAFSTTLLLVFLPKRILLVYQLYFIDKHVEPSNLFLWKLFLVSFVI